MALTDEDLFYVQRGTDGHKIKYENLKTELVGDLSIDDLTDVDTSTNPPQDGSSLVWDGTNWVPTQSSVDTPSITSPADGTGTTHTAISDDIIRVAPATPDTPMPTIFLEGNKDLDKFLPGDRAVMSDSYVDTGTLSVQDFGPLKQEAELISANPGAFETSDNKFYSGCANLGYKGVGYSCYQIQNSKGIFNFGTGDFTFCFWMKSDKWRSTSQNNYIFDQSGTVRYAMVNLGSSTPATGQLALYFNHVQIPTPIDPKPEYNDAWIHIAIIRKDGMLRSFVNGVKLKEASFPNDTPEASANLSFGSYDDRATAYGSASCLMQDFLTCHGAIWWDDFTPPGRMINPDNGQLESWVPTDDVIMALPLESHAINVYGDVVTTDNDNLAISMQDAKGTWIAGKHAIGATRSFGEGLGKNPTFTSTPFSGEGTTHISSDWQVATDENFNNIAVQSIGDTANLTSWTSPDLTENTNYWVRVQHNGTTSSGWSAASSFKTKAVF